MATLIVLPSATGSRCYCLVGADWCAPCKQLRDCHPSLATRGHLVHLDVAQHSSLLGSLRLSWKLARIPLLLIWHHGRWKVLAGPAAIRQYAIGSRHLTPDP